MSAKRVASELTVAILPLGNVSPEQITLTEEVLEQEFGVKTMVMEPVEIPPQYFNAERNRYQVQQILDFLFFQLPANAQRIMGIADGFLEYGSENSCLGFSDFDNMAAIYSVPCLTLGPYLSTAQNIISRFATTHEFGHTLGLKHCKQSYCAMHVSSLSMKMCAFCRRWADRELKVKPDSAEERFSRAEALWRHGCAHEAIAIYRQAISRAPHELLYQHRLGMALDKVGEKNEATQLLITLLNDIGNTNYGLGLIFMKNDVKKAEDYFAKAIAKAKNPQSMQRLVGHAYREMRHDVRRASRHYMEYLRLGGNDQDVIDWLTSRSELNNS